MTKTRKSKWGLSQMADGDTKPLPEKPKALSQLISAISTFNSKNKDEKKKAVIDWDKNIYKVLVK